MPLNVVYSIKKQPRVNRMEKEKNAQYSEELQKEIKRVEDAMRKYAKNRDIGVVNYPELFGLDHDQNFNAYWAKVSSISSLSEEFMTTFSDQLDWHNIFRHQKLSDDFIRKFSHKINPHSLFLYQKMSEVLLKEILLANDYVNSWFHVSLYQKLSEDFIEKYHNCVDWRNISQFQVLSEEFIEKFSHRVFWKTISCYQKLSERFIEKHEHELHFDDISQFQKLSEDFIEKFRHRLYWPDISQYQKLSENFIEKFKDNVDWEYIIKYQKLSEEFIEKFKCKVDCNYIIKYQKLSENFIEKLHDGFLENINCDYMDNCRRIYINAGAYQKISKEFMDKHDIPAPSKNWLYETIEAKESYIKKNSQYEIQEDEQGKYVLAYKGIRRDNYSVFNFQYK